jgi:hypothetical protein
MFLDLIKILKKFKPKKLLNSQYKIQIMTVII